MVRTTTKKVFIFSNFKIENLSVFVFVRLDWDRWVMMGMIGFVVGIIGFLLHQFIDLIADTKWRIATELLHVNFVHKSKKFNNF